MNATLSKIANTLKQRPSVEAVRRCENAVYTEGGKIRALSCTTLSDETLQLGEEAADLEYLYLSGNKSLKKVVLTTALPRLTHLYLDGCGLTEIVISVGCDSLRQLYLQKNPFTNIVFEGHLPALELLDLSESQLTSFALSEGYDNLKYLYLNKNQIENIGTADFPKLDTLQLADNQLKNLPLDYFSPQTDVIQFYLCGKPVLALQSVYLSGNPLPDDIRGFVENDNTWADKNGLPPIKAYFQDLSKGNALDNEYKTLIIGNGNVGKSCLVHRLVHNEFIENWNSTHGIALEQYPRENSEKDTYVFNLWDFGGQDIYHATHRLFMKSNALYLVLWDKQTKDTPFTEHEIDGVCRQYENFSLPYWLDYTRSQGQNSPAIVVQTKSIADGEILISDIQSKYKDLVSSFVHIDSKEDDWDENGINNLLTAMRKGAKKFGRKGTTPKNRADVRQLLRLKQKAGEKRMSLTDYLDLAKNLTDPISVLENWLVKTGVVFYKKGLFQDDIILDQAWAIDAVYTIFRRTTKRGRTYYDFKHDNGRFTGADLQEIWADNHPEEQKLFISFMLSCDICFETTQQENPDLKDSDMTFENRSFVAPQLMSDEQPKHIENILLGKKSWYLTYKHDFLHYGIIQSFITRTQTLADMQDIWKSGILLREDAHFALVTCQNKEINVRVTEGGKDLFDKIRNLLETLQDKQGTETVSLDGIQYVSFKELKSYDKDNTRIRTETGDWIDIKQLSVFLERDEKKNFEDKNTLKSDRGILKIPVKADLIANNKPIIVQMAEDARLFIPFSDIKEQIKILFLAAGQLNTGKESRFKDLLRYFDQERRFLYKDEHGVTTEQFQNFLLFEDPHIVHYGGHGLTEGIVLEDDTLDAEILGGILRLSEKTQCVILNACYSLSIAKSLAEHIPYVIGTQNAIDDRTAIAFAKGFYMGIVAGKTIEQAFQNGVLTVKREKLPNADVLILVKGQR